MTDINLNSLSSEELKRLRKNIDKAIDSYDARMKKQAVAAVEAKARELGFSLVDLAGGTVTPKTVNPPKYAHPENPTLTWTGRGRQPDWIKDGLERGKALEDFLIT